MRIRLNFWNWAAIIGFVRIILQFSFPDFVAIGIENAIAENAKHPAIGLDPTLKAVLLLWMVWGFVSFIVGIIGTFYTINRNNRRNFG